MTEQEYAERLFEKHSGNYARGGVFMDYKSFQLALTEALQAQREACCNNVLDLPQMKSIFDQLGFASQIDLSVMIKKACVEATIEVKP